MNVTSGTTEGQQDFSGLDPEEEVSQLFADLRTRVDGLDEREAARRLLQIGANEIRHDSGPPWWRSLVDQLIHPLALLLWVAAALSLATGVVALAVAIVVVIPLNAAFAFAQERQAEHATEPFRDLLPQHARVRRGGVLVEIEATALHEIGVLSNPLLLGGIAFELIFAAAVIYLPVLQESSTPPGSARPSSRGWRAFP